MAGKSEKAEIVKEVTLLDYDDSFGKKVNKSVHILN